jgi:hypothetical protein
MASDPFIHHDGEVVFLGRPGLSHFGREASKQEQKVSGPSTPQYTSSDLVMYIVYYFIFYF